MGRGTFADPSPCHFTHITSSLSPDDAMPIVPLSEVVPVPTRWLWPRWLARGHLHVFDGDPGVGKSMLTGDLAARISSGRPWPDGSPAGEPASVILLNAEDDAAGVTHRRLVALGADLDHVHVWRSDSGEALPLLPGGVESLRNAVKRRRPQLVVVDPITAFLDRSVSFHCDPDVRRALRPLATLAAEEDCAIVLVRHLTKSPGRQSLYRGLGSIGFVAAARIAWLAARDPFHPGRCVLAGNKSNLAELPTSLSYELLRPDAAAANPLLWHGSSPTVAADLIVPPRRRDRARAVELLAKLLDVPRTTIEIRAAARTHGLSYRTMQRAARDLAVHYRRLGNPIIGQTIYWLLPGQKIPDSALDPSTLDPWLIRMDG